MTTLPNLSSSYHSAHCALLIPLCPLCPPHTTLPIVPSSYPSCSMPRCSMLPSHCPHTALTLPSHCPDSARSCRRVALFPCRLPGTALPVGGADRGSRGRHHIPDPRPSLAPCLGPLRAARSTPTLDKYNPSPTLNIHNPIVTLTPDYRLRWALWGHAHA